MAHFLARNSGPARVQEPMPARAATQQSMEWPEDLLAAFGMRMAGHGMSISRVEMQRDPRYALQQLAHARELGDAHLNVLAEQMFRLFETQRSGVDPVSH